MPIAEFLDRFFPLDAGGLDTDETTKYAEIDFGSVPDLPEKEEEMYDGLVSMRPLILHKPILTNTSVAI